MNRINKTLNYIRNIFSRDNFAGEDGPRDPNSRKNYSVSNSLLNMSQLSGYDTGWNDYADGFSAQDDLLSRYADYEYMDDYGELSNAFDIFADEACQMDSITKQIVHTEAEDERIGNLLYDCFHKNLRIDERIWEIARTTVKYGNDFEEHVVSETDGLIDIKFLPPPQMRRIDDLLGSLQGFALDKQGLFSVSTEEFESRIMDRELNYQKYVESLFTNNVYEDWEVTHFRIRSRHREAPYGFSILEHARTVMKRLAMLEDAALLYKITRAPQRFAFNIDVGDIPPNEVKKYLEDVKNMMKKQKVLDPDTGKIDLQAGLMNSQEDFYIPVRKDKTGMSIDEVGGFDSSFYMDDLEYFKDKLYAAIKVPKDYLNYTEDSVSKANLSTMDIRFSRTILRIQNDLRTGLINMGRVHLASHGIDPDVPEYNIYLTAPSAIFEMAMMEVKQAQLDIAENFKAFVDDYWIMKNILKFDDDEINGIKKRLKKQREEDDPFSENRFPTLESKRKMNPEVKKVLDDMGEQALLNDKKIGKRLVELQKMAHEMKTILKRKK